MNLYQFAWGVQSHYVVAISFADAERAITKEGYSFKKIECLGPYIIISEYAAVCAAEDNNE